MRAAQVTSWSEPPVFTTVPDLPEPTDNEIRLRVLATGLHRVVRSKASGEHYSASSLPQLPGVDGVGEDASGNRYYFFTFNTGSFSEFLNVDKKAVWPMPSGADPVVVAALLNPVMSSWMALSRVPDLKPGFSVAILGVTSASGRVAVDVAHARGAGRVVGIARSSMQHKHLNDFVALSPNTDWSKLGPVDVILDYVYGPTAADMLKSLTPSGREVNFVQIGTLAGSDMTLDASLLRSKKLALRGAAPGSWSMDEFETQVPGMLKLLAGMERTNVVVKKLADVQTVWGEKIKERVVFVNE